MNHPSNFQHAAYRAHHAAVTLRDHEQAQAGDHVGGLAAECALKAVLEALGFFNDDRGVPLDKVPERFHEHLPIIWDELVLVMGGRAEGRLLASLPMQNPFSAWSIFGRYDGDWEAPHSAAEARVEGEMATMRVLEAALLDGVLG